ncbi:IS5-like element ISPsp10 family transposase [Pseudomonas mosselii]|uniref:IS5-like element ISPsp10 family transposase n=1 Tax=Pseudomonas mosselii TaxID=78327 RepID=UPI0025A55038|nr:IS5-like element ISPsp10 family transposase [Pseudomonas mosselii]WJR26037.1 IS5-like element ISPsp10 family transposase [Pseudomonas mosselii]WJR26763.1 IS5-like element ISPsp10 family transposase [Pseudomonas mosselii]WJR26784.1 IS5-like element ISPsp10 family transposase [Pseudomonas mosselii]WJR26928.1 IS5-like element ISPsp10 family transposase [Pseudomonas mosselii]WJR30769.1 IS5-like element ISPsp10 family transposase [Pseudomonas mosselii]
MSKRYELSDAEWEIVADLFTAHRRTGRPRVDDRLMLNGVLWVLCSGATWRDMPERFGPWSTVYQRFRDWRNQGTFNKMLKRLHLKLNAQGQIDLTTWCIDSTAVRATRASAGAGKRGAEEPTDHALGRSRGGLTTKIHMVSDARGIPLHFTLSGGHASDISHAQRLLDGVHIPSNRGRPRKRCRWLLADKGYDAESLRQYCDRYRMQPVIPLRDMKRRPKPGLPRLFDKPKYRQRNAIERLFGWLKEHRRLGTRYCKLAESFAAMVTLACWRRCLRHYFSYSA